MNDDQPKPLPDRLELIRDVLDKHLVDAQGCPLGRADSVIVQCTGGPPRVLRVEAGAPALARRLGDRPGRWIAALGRRWGLHRGKPVRISFNRLAQRGLNLQVPTAAARSPLLAWERWFERHVVRFIPGRKSR